jgi:hypothetical protein
MKVYPPEDATTRRSQNPGPFPLSKVVTNPLVEGDKRNSDLVRHLQKMLLELGYLVNPQDPPSRMLDGVDGVFGTATKTAVQQFQTDHTDWDMQALPSSGQVDEKTADALNRAMVGIWYPVYWSVDGSGKFMPPDIPLSLDDEDRDRVLVTLDADHPLEYKDRRPASQRGPLPANVKNVKVMTVGAKGGLPGRWVQFVPNDPEVSGQNPKTPLERLVVKEAHLMNLHDAGLPFWKIRAGTADALEETGPPTGFKHPSAGNFPYRIPSTKYVPKDHAGFLVRQVHLTLARTIRMWRLRGLTFSEWRKWSSGTGSSGILEVTCTNPAAYDAAAFYSPKTVSLESGISPDEVTVVGDSADVISHECGHGVLDAVAPQLLGGMVFEGQSFQESFGDISAILTTLMDQDVREAVLKATGGDLSKSNPASRVAEQMGRIILNQPPLRDAVMPNPVPDFFTIFTKADKGAGHPDFAFEYLDRSEITGPDTGKKYPFSRIFTMAFYEGLVSAYNRLLAARYDLAKAGVELSDPDKKDEALREAAGCMGTLLATAIKRHTAVEERYFKTIAREMFAADRQLFKGEFMTDMFGTVNGDRYVGGFVGRGLLPMLDISITPDASGTTDPPSAANVTVGTSLSIKGKPAKGYKFKEWQLSVGAQAIAGQAKPMKSTTSPIKVSVAAPAELVAVFEPV